MCAFVLLVSAQAYMHVFFNVSGIVGHRCRCISNRRCERTMVLSGNAAVVLLCSVCHVMYTCVYVWQSAKDSKSKEEKTLEVAEGWLKRAQK